MKGLKKWIVIGLALSLSGCAAGMMYLPIPRDMTTAGKGYHVHTMNGVKLYKIKAPAADWYTMSSSLFQRNGTDEPLQFSSHGAGNQYPVIWMVSGFNPTDDDKEFENMMEFIKGNAEPWVSSLKSGLDKRGKIYIENGIKNISGINCLSGEHRVKDEAINRKSFSRSISCPGYFRNTLGDILIYIDVSDNGIRNARTLDEQYQILEPAIEKSLNSLKFITHFSQVAPANYSFEEQKARIKAGEKENGPSEFKL